MGICRDKTMYLGDFNSDIAVPIVGSDAMTTGLSPTTMHVDPVSGLPEAMAVAPGTTVVVTPAAAAPASSGMSPLFLIALAGVAWYGYKQGWFTEILQKLGVEI